MTGLLLTNKKLLNENITEFIYNNELFNNTITDIITLFIKRYLYKEHIIISDKIIIYKLYIENQGNIKLYKNIINDFIELFKFLNNKRKENLEKNQDIKEE